MEKPQNLKKKNNPPNKQTNTTKKKNLKKSHPEPKGKKKQNCFLLFTFREWFIPDLVPAACIRAPWGLRLCWFSTHPLTVCSSWSPNPSSFPPPVHDLYQPTEVAGRDLQPDLFMCGWRGQMCCTLLWQLALWNLYSSIAFMDKSGDRLAVCYY